MMTIAVALSSIGIGIGVIGLSGAVRRRPAPGDVNQAIDTVGSARRSPLLRGLSGSVAGHRRGSARMILPVISGLVIGAITRWPVAAVLAAVAAAALPSAMKSTASQSSIRRAEAVAVWTELLRDTLTASAGLAQAIVATSGVAPTEIREPAGRLADRIMSGVPMDDALRLFAGEIGDPSVDEVVSALRLASTSRAQRLVDLLSALADSTRDVVAMRLRVEASRSSARSGVRMVIWFSVGFVALLTVMARSYLAPFGSVTGQLVLLVVGVLYAAGLILMVRLVRSDSWRSPSRDLVGT
jgi:Flp pilus assembly protein TadB